MADSPPADVGYPAVAVVIPVRNEAATVGRTVESLLSQDYGGKVSVFVVDDNSDDGTAEATEGGAGDKGGLRVVTGLPLEDGWTGKLWAVSQGIAAVDEGAAGAEFLLLTDADIEHPPSILRRLVEKARSGDLDLVSLMVRLRCRSIWERLLIPAFVFFLPKALSVSLDQ